MNNLANAFKALGKFDDAIEHLEKCSQINRREHGSVSVEYAKTLANLANAMECAGRADAAADCFELAHDMFRLLLGREHQYCAAMLLNIAVSHRTRNQIDKARSALDESMRIYEHVLFERKSAERLND
jgi:tetratricopeptide (TPR) repeat protein